MVLQIVCWNTACKGGVRSSRDKGEPAVSVPVLSDMGVVCPVTGLHGKDGSVSIFKYHKNKMVGGYSSDYGTFTITSNPLEIRVSDSGQHDSLTYNRELNYSNIYTNADGYVTSMDFDGKEMRTGASGKTVESFKGNISAVYDVRGHIMVFNYDYNDRQGNQESGKVKYKWVGDNIETVVLDVFAEKHLRESHEILTFIYDTDSVRLNKGFYWEEMNPFFGMCDFVWYAGLFGKTTRNVPRSIIHERMGDGQDFREVSDIAAEYNAEGAMTSLAYNGVWHSSFDYRPVKDISERVAAMRK